MLLMTIGTLIIPNPAIVLGLCILVFAVRTVVKGLGTNSRRDHIEYDGYEGGNRYYEGDPGWISNDDEPYRPR